MEKRGEEAKCLFTGPFIESSFPLLSPKITPHDSLKERQLLSTKTLP